MTNLPIAPGRRKTGAKPVSRTPDPISFERFVELVESKTGQCGRSGNYHCPAHEDAKPSLTVGRGRGDREVVFCCQAGCSFQEVLHGLGLTPRDFYGQRESEEPRRRVAEYLYQDEAGERTLRKVRYRPKAFSWEHLEGQTWKPGLAGRSPKLYLSDQLPGAIAAGQTIFLVEGEKDAESLREIGLVGTTGHSSGPLTLLQAEQLRGADVAVIPDQDPSGQKQALGRWQNLEGVAGERTWLELPIDQDGADVTDWLVAGGTQSALLELIQDRRGSSPDQPAPEKDDSALHPEFDLTDLGVATWTQEREDVRVLFNVDRKKWMRWSEGGWLLDPGESVIDELRHAREHLEQVIQARRALNRGASEDDRLPIPPIAKWRDRLGMARGINDVLRCWRSLASAQAFERSFDADRDATVDAGGTRYHAHEPPRMIQPSDRTTKRLGVSVSYEGVCKRWRDFLEDLSCGDSQLAWYIECALGHSIFSGQTSEQVFFFAYGDGSTGKSTLMSVAHEIAGCYGAVLPKSALTVRGQLTAAPYISDLVGKRFVTVDEITAERIDESIIKQLTGGDLVKAMRKYEHPFDFRPQLKLWIIGNEQPRIAGTDSGIWRRVRLIPFRHVFRQAIRDYHQVLLANEGPQIAARLLDAAQVVRISGLPECEQVESSSATYRREQDLFGQFLEECFERDPDSKVTTERVVESHRAWSERNGFDRLGVTKTKVGRELSGRGFEQTRIKRGGKQLQGWKGLRAL